METIFFVSFMKKRRENFATSVSRSCRKTHIHERNLAIASNIPILVNLGPLTLDEDLTRFPELTSSIRKYLQEGRLFHMDVRIE
jgi:hypothetical protein